MNRNKGKRTSLASRKVILRASLGRECMSQRKNFSTVVSNKDATHPAASPFERTNITSPVRTKRLLYIVSTMVPATCYDGSFGRISRDQTATATRDIAIVIVIITIIIIMSLIIVIIIIKMTAIAT